MCVSICLYVCVCVCMQARCVCTKSERDGANEDEDETRGKRWAQVCLCLIFNLNLINWAELISQWARKQTHMHTQEHFWFCSAMITCLLASAHTNTTMWMNTKLHTLPAACPMAGSTVGHEILSNSIIHLLPLLLSLILPSSPLLFLIPSSLLLIPYRLVASCLHSTISLSQTCTSIQTFSQLPLYQTVSSILSIVSNTNTDTVTHCSC